LISQFKQTLKAGAVQSMFPPTKYRFPIGALNFGKLIQRLEKINAPIAHGNERRRYCEAKTDSAKFLHIDQSSNFFHSADHPRPISQPEFYYFYPP